MVPLVEFPSGTVTFLFTDIEGSTRLLRELGERYNEALATHHRILRAAFAAHGGHEMGTEGDAFFIAFRRARDAVAAAVDAQKALSSESWLPGGEIRVRMGIHTGEPTVDEHGYVGLALNFAARLTSAAHGGQVLLSKATHELVADDLPGGVRIRELGQHRLKDFDRPQPLYQLVIDGLRSEFPALNTLELQRESTRIATQTSLVAAAASVTRPRRVRRRELMIFALVGVVAAAAAIPIFALGRGGGGGGYISSNSVAAIDPHTGSVVAEGQVGAEPTDVAFSGGALWVANLGDETITRVDTQTGRPVRTLPAAGIKALTGTPKGLWVMSREPGSTVVKVSRIDPRYNVVTSSVDVPSSAYGGETGGIAASAQGIWAVSGGIGRISRIDQHYPRVDATINAESCCPSMIAVGAGAVWVADPYANKLVHLDNNNSVDETIPLGQSPAGVAVGAGSVWVTISQQDQVVRIDPNTNAAVATIPVGHFPTAIAFGGGGVWVANTDDGSVSKIDPKKNKVTDTIVVGQRLHGITFAAGRVWVTAQSPTSAPLSSSGIARLDALNDVDSIDPGVAYVPISERTRTRFTPLSWQIEYATCAKLMNYPDRAGTRGAELEPEVASRPPSISADGRTLVFKIRKDFRFSPPSNEPLRAETFKYSIERALSPTLAGPARPQVVLRSADGARATLDPVVGADAFSAGKARHISGILARGNTLTFQLVRRTPDFLFRLAQPFFCPVPLDTPFRQTFQPIPSAGPYYIASYSRGRELVLRRNPNYTGSRPHHLKEIRLAIGISPADSVRQVDEGQADYVIDGMSPSDDARLRSLYGPKSRAAKHGRQRYFVNPTFDVFFVALNTTRPPFSDVSLRKAASYAIDRRRLARLLALAFLVKPTDQYLPPTVLGFENAHLYPSSSNSNVARHLLGRRTVQAVLYSCDVCAPIADELQADLQKAGIALSVKTFSLEQTERKIRTRGAPFDIAFSAWTTDYPDPGSFLSPLFDGNTIRPTNNSNVAYFNQPRYNQALQAAASLSGQARYAAYGRLDVELARDAVPVVPVGVALHQDYFSKRMGCEIYNPAYGMDLAALCIRP